MELYRWWSHTCSFNWAAAFASNMMWSGYCDLLFWKAHEWGWEDTSWGGNDTLDQERNEHSDANASCLETFKTESSWAWALLLLRISSKANSLVHFGTNWIEMADRDLRIACRQVKGFLLELSRLEFPHAASLDQSWPYCPPRLRTADTQDARNNATGRCPRWRYDRLPYLVYSPDNLCPIRSPLNSIFLRKRILRLRCRTRLDTITWTTQLSH